MSRVDTKKVDSMAFLDLLHRGVIKEPFTICIPSPTGDQRLVEVTDLKDIAQNLYNLGSIILNMDDLPDGRADWIERSLWEATKPLVLPPKEEDDDNHG